MIRAALLTVLMLMFASATATAEPKTIRIVKVKSVGKSKLCQGFNGDRIARNLKSGLGKTKILRVFGPKRKIPADYVLTAEFLCHKDHIEFIVQIVEVDTAAIVFVNSQTLDDLGQMDSAINKAVTLISAYFRVGKMPDEAESTVGEKSPLFEHTITLLPLHTTVKGFTGKNLLSSTRYLRVRLEDAVKCSVEAGGVVLSAIKTRKRVKCIDEKCHLEIAGDLGTNKALAAKIVRTGKRCALSYTLYDVDQKSIEKAASIFMKCSNPGLKVAIDQLVRQISGEK